MRVSIGTDQLPASAYKHKPVIMSETLDYQELSDWLKRFQEDEVAHYASSAIYFSPVEVLREKNPVVIARQFIEGRKR